MTMAMVVPAVVGVVRVMAVGAVVVHVLAVRVVFVDVAVGMGMHVGMLMGMRGAVLMGVLVHVGMLMLVVMVVNGLTAVGMLVNLLILAEIAAAGLAHMSLLGVIVFFPLLKEYRLFFKRQARKEINSMNTNGYIIFFPYCFLLRFRKSCTGGHNATHIVIRAAHNNRNALFRHFHGLTNFIPICSD